MAQLVRLPVTLAKTFIPSTEFIRWTEVLRKKAEDKWLGNQPQYDYLARIAYEIYCFRRIFTGEPERKPESFKVPYTLVGREQQATTTKEITKRELTEEERRKQYEQRLAESKAFWLMGMGLTPDGKFKVKMPPKKVAANGPGTDRSPGGSPLGPVRADHGPGGGQNGGGSPASGLGGSAGV